MRPFLFVVLLIVSCQSGKRTESIYGSWIDVAGSGMRVSFDSVSSQMTIDYSKNGGGKFLAPFELDSGKILKSKLLPKGGSIYFSEKGELSIYPYPPTGDVEESIELIYAVRLKRMK